MSSGAISTTNSYGVSSVSDNGVGLFTINFSSAFNGSDYAFAGSTVHASTSANARVIVSGNTTNPPSTTSLQVITTRADTNANTDPINSWSVNIVR